MKTGGGWKTGGRRLGVGGRLEVGRRPEVGGRPEMGGRLEVEDWRWVEDRRWVEDWRWVEWFASLSYEIQCKLTSVLSFQWWELQKMCYRNVLLLAWGLVCFVSGMGEKCYCVNGCCMRPDFSCNSLLIVTLPFIIV